MKSDQDILALIPKGKTLDVEQDISPLIPQGKTSEVKQNISPLTATAVEQDISPLIPQGMTSKDIPLAFCIRGTSEVEKDH